MPFIARWDLDKTYLRTEFNTVADLLRTALERADQKRTVPGAGSLLRELGASGARVHILSGSPRQMRGRLAEKLRLDGVRFESLTLKPNLENILRFRLRAVHDQLGYKLPALLSSRAQIPNVRVDNTLVREVLLGDDAEADALVYSIYADICAGVVDDTLLTEILHRGRVYDDAVSDALRFARLVDKGDVVQRILIHLERQSAPGRFSVFGPRVVPFYNYLQAALVLLDDGLLSANGVVRVAAELVIDHRFDAEALARSFLDLFRRGGLRRSTLVDEIREAASSMSTGSKLSATAEVQRMCDRLDVLTADVVPAEVSQLKAPVPESYPDLVTRYASRRSKWGGLLDV